MRISTKGRGIIRAQQGAVARPNPKENYKLPEDQRYQAQTRGMKDFAIEWYKERAKQPKYQSQVNESNLANITDQINRAEYVEPSKFYSNPNVYKGKVGNVTILGIPVANIFTLYVNVNQSGLQHFSLDKDINRKWKASPLSNT